MAARKEWGLKLPAPQVLLALLPLLVLLGSSAYELLARRLRPHQHPVL
ncbi:MAG: hypothetical protein ACRDY7_17250 [Acidimicrobiia bacterium]